ncbi:MAG: hypothetical protein U0800_03965 [Isosphaeraceae bacterium]
MRRLAPALLGLALAAPLAASAQSPSCKDCAQGYVVNPSQMPSNFRAPKLCSDCYNRYKKTGVWPLQSPPPGQFPVAGSPGYAPQMAGQPQYAGTPGVNSGYAMSGDSWQGDGPAPIGVMRTNYRAGMPNAGFNGAPGYAVSGGMPGAAMPQRGPIAYASPEEVSLLAGPSSDRSNVLRTLMGGGGWRRWQNDREAQRRALHAQQAYGVGSAPSELPANMVYGGGPR